MKVEQVFVHVCKRCNGQWRSKSKSPRRCGKCKSPYWSKARKVS